MKRNPDFAAVILTIEKLPRNKTPGKVDTDRYRVWLHHRNKLCLRRKIYLFVDFHKESGRLIMTWCRPSKQNCQQKGTECKSSMKMPVRDQCFRREVWYSRYQLWGRWKWYLSCSQIILDVKDFSIEEKHLQAGVPSAERCAWARGRRGPVGRNSRNTFLFPRPFAMVL